VRGWLALLAAVWVLGAFVSWQTLERPPWPLQEGERAPGFSLLDAASQTPVSLADYRGRVVFLNFWATWCEPCEAEMPAMEQVYRRFAGDDFEMLAVSVDEDAAEIDAFRERLELGFPILHDPEKQVADRYQSFRFPETWWIDRDGVLVARFIGPRDWTARAYLDRLERLIAATP